MLSLKSTKVFGLIRKVKQGYYIKFIAGVLCKRVKIMIYMTVYSMGVKIFLSHLKVLYERLLVFHTKHKIVNL